MADFVDLGPNSQIFFDTPALDTTKYRPYSTDTSNGKSDQNGNFNKKSANKTWYDSFVSKKQRKGFHQRTLDPRFLEVRSSICVTGFHREAIQLVKSKMAGLLEEPVPLESFHINRMSDVREGSLLVPKVVMVAVHCPGKKLIDEDGNEGQLDLLYDELCDLGADLMVVYLDLPRTIYPPFRHMVYHPKMAEILFPTQPLIREWAETNSLVTVTEGSDFTNMQKNVLREWMRRPVDSSTHQVYKSAECLSSVEWSLSDAEFYSEPETVHRSQSVPGGAAAASSYSVENEFVSAEEHHPLADDASSKKRKKKSRRKNLFRLGRRDRREEVVEKKQMDLISLEEDDVELELYNASENPLGAYSNNMDTFSNISV